MLYQKNIVTFTAKKNIVSSFQMTRNFLMKLYDDKKENFWRDSEYEKKDTFTKLA